MKSDATLQRYYDRLTGLERFALILAAEERGDKSEVQMLIHTAPRLSFRAPNYMGALDAFNYIGMVYLIHQLDTALTVSTLAHLDEGSDDLMIAAYLGASILVRRAEGWKKFCAEIGVDPNQVFAAFPEVQISLEFALKVAETVALTPEEVETELKKKDPEAVNHWTVEAVAEDYRKAFDSWASKWE